MSQSLVDHQTTKANNNSEPESTLNSLCLREWKTFSRPTKVFIFNDLCYLHSMLEIDYHIWLYRNESPGCDQTSSRKSSVCVKIENDSVYWLRRYKKRNWNYANICLKNSNSVVHLASKQLDRIQKNPLRFMNNLAEKFTHRIAVCVCVCACWTEVPRNILFGIKTASVSWTVCVYVNRSHIQPRRAPLSMTQVNLLVSIVVFFFSIASSVEWNNSIVQRERVYMLTCRCCAFSF